MNVAKHSQKFRCSATMLIIKVEWPFPLEWEMFPQYNYILLHTKTIWKKMWIRVAKNETILWIVQNEEINSETRHCSWKPLNVSPEVMSHLKSCSFQKKLLVSWDVLSNLKDWFLRDALEVNYAVLPIFSLPHFFMLHH